MKGLSFILENMRIGTQGRNQRSRGLADTPLVRNLDNEENYKIILNGCHTLEERFALVDAKIVIEELKQAKKSQEKISPEIKTMIKQPELPEKISTLYWNFCNN